MALNQKVAQLKRLDTLIRLRNTGNPKQLAQKPGISESTHYHLLQQAKEMGADICYNPHRHTYEYISPLRFVFGIFNPDYLSVNNLFFKWPHRISMLCTKGLFVDNR